MKPFEALCYLLNRGGRHYARRIDGEVDRAAESAFALKYRDRFRPPDGVAERYVRASGSFLGRYEQAVRRYAAFPGEAFAGRRVLVIGAGRGVDVLHLAHDRGAAHVTGVEIDEGLCEFARGMLADHGVRNATIVCADMAAASAVPSESAELAVSMATFEHVMDLPGVLRETFRVLRPGGTLHAEFSPIWRHYYGSHLGKYLPFPWTHLLFDEETVGRTLTRLQRRPHAPPIYRGLNRLSLAEYRRIAEESPFEVLSFELTTRSRLKRALHRIPVLNEYVAGGVVLRLRKP
jgi:ubiquinone/menaquinone biosynthesis C-methylase UbiE